MRGRGERNRGCGVLTTASSGWRLRTELPDLGSGLPQFGIAQLGQLGFESFAVVGFAVGFDYDLGFVAGLNALVEVFEYR